MTTVANAKTSRWFRLRRSVLALHGAVLAWLTAVSFLLFHQVFAGGHFASRMFDGQHIDSSQQVWFFGYGARLLSHLSHPFWSDLMYAGQGGFNLLSQTSVLIIGMILSPVTWLLGPLAAANLATVMAPVATGYAMFLCLRALTRSTFGQILGATLFAFLPATIGPAQGGHLMLTVLWYPPLVTLLLHDLLVTKKRSPRTIGLLLGVLTIVQFFIGTEVLAITVAIAVPTLLLALVIRPKDTEIPWRRLWRAAGLGGALAGVVLAYPLWFALAGPQHVTGPAWAVVSYAHYQPWAIAHSLTTSVGSSTPGSGRNLSGAFLGWAVLSAVVVSLWLMKRRLAVLMVFVAVFAWTLTLGRAFGSTSPWSVLLPMRQLSHLPLFDAVLPTRFAAFSGFGIAVLLAMSVDAWLDVLRTKSAAWSKRANNLARGALGLGFAATLLPFALTYSSPPASAVHEPWWFAHRSHTINPSHTVLVFPTYRSVLYEAMEGFPFKTVGGYAIIPDANGKSSFTGAREDLDTFLREAEVLGAALENPSRPELEHIQGSLRQRSVDHVVILTRSLNAGYVAATMTALTGTLPTIDHRVMVWSGLRGHAYPVVTDQAVAAIDACALNHRQSAAVAVRCVAGLLELK
jgi:hypothetical protein